VIFHFRFFSCIIVPRDPECSAGAVSDVREKSSVMYRTQSSFLNINFVSGFQRVLLPRDADDRGARPAAGRLGLRLPRAHP
jgi:hypothetical protein